MSSRAFARNTSPIDSHIAASKVNASQLCIAVVDILKKKGPLTTKEIAAQTAIPRVSVSPRMKPLTDMGVVRRTGQRRGGCAVWEVINTTKTAT